MLLRAKYRTETGVFDCFFDPENELAYLSIPQAVSLFLANGASRVDFSKGDDTVYIDVANGASRVDFSKGDDTVYIDVFMETGPEEGEALETHLRPTVDGAKLVTHVPILFPGSVEGVMPEPGPVPEGSPESLVYEVQRTREEGVEVWGIVGHKPDKSVFLEIDMEVEAGMEVFAGRFLDQFSKNLMSGAHDALAGERSDDEGGVRPGA